jgi:hypothetical protein
MRILKRRLLLAGLSATVFLSIALVWRGAVAPRIRYQRYIDRIVATQKAEVFNAQASGEPIRVGLVGDSITWQAGDDFAKALGSKLNRPVLLVNRAMPMAASSDWLPDGKLFCPSVEAFRANHVVIIGVMLGVNDNDQDKTPAAFKADMAAASGALDTKRQGDGARP